MKIHIFFIKDHSQTWIDASLQWLPHSVLQGPSKAALTQSGWCQCRLLKLRWLPAWNNTIPDTRTIHALPRENINCNRSIEVSHLWSRPFILCKTTGKRRLMKLAQFERQGQKFSTWDQCLKLSYTSFFHLRLWKIPLCCTNGIIFLLQGWDH